MFAMIFHNFRLSRSVKPLRAAGRGITCALALALLQSCVTNDMKDMHNDTHTMAGETQQLVNNTGDVVHTSDKLVGETGTVIKQTEILSKKTSEVNAKLGYIKSTTGTAYTQGRQGDSATLRVKLIELMEKAPNLPGKLDAAGQYFDAFEFQVWRNQDSDTDKVRNELFLDAFTQFFEEVQKYDPHLALNIDPTSHDGNQENLNALAATMHYVNRNQLEMAKETGARAVSVLSLLEDTLKLRASVNSGETSWESLPKYQQLILENEKIAVYMLRLRTNVIPVLLLANISRINDHHFDTGITHWLGVPQLEFYGLRDLLLPFNTVNLQKSDRGPLERDLEWITETNREFDVLQNDLGLNPRICYVVRRLYVDLNLPKLKTPDSNEQAKDRSATTLEKTSGTESKDLSGPANDDGLTPAVPGPQANADQNDAQQASPEEQQKQQPADNTADQAPKQKLLSKLISGIQDFEKRFQGRYQPKH